MFEKEANTAESERKRELSETFSQKLIYGRVRIRMSWVENG